MRALDKRGGGIGTLLGADVRAEGRVRWKGGKGAYRVDKVVLQAVRFCSKRWCGPTPVVVVVFFRFFFFVF
jgi:hypothetical protein